MGSVCEGSQHVIHLRMAYSILSEEVEDLKNAIRVFLMFAIFAESGIDVHLIKIEGGDVCWARCPQSTTVADEHLALLGMGIWR